MQNVSSYIRNIKLLGSYSSMGTHGGMAMTTMDVTTQQQDDSEGTITEQPTGMASSTIEDTIFLVVKAEREWSLS